MRAPFTGFAAATVVGTAEAVGAVGFGEGLVVVEDVPPPQLPRRVAVAKARATSAPRGGEDVADMEASSHATTGSDDRSRI